MCHYHAGKITETKFRFPLGKKSNSKNTMTYHGSSGWCYWAHQVFQYQNMFYNRVNTSPDFASCLPSCFYLVVLVYLDQNFAKHCWANYCQGNGHVVTTCEPSVRVSYWSFSWTLGLPKAKTVCYPVDYKSWNEEHFKQALFRFPPHYMSGACSCYCVFIEVA